jgi:hypothetical protein
VQRMRLQDLPSADVTPMCTLYVPAKELPPPNPEMYALLKGTSPGPSRAQ